MATFTDANGRQWSPRITTPALMAWSRAERISLSQIGNMDDMTAAAALSLLWHSCSDQARERNLSDHMFYEAIPLNKIGEAVEALGAAMEESMPSDSDSDLPVRGAGGEETAAPFIPSAT